MEQIEIIKYFAKYPLKAGVIKNFARNDNVIPGYTDLLNYCTALDPHSLIPDLADYVVSTDESELSAKIKNIDGYFLMVEVGGINGGAKNNVKVRDSQFTIQLTIGHHKDMRSLDDMAAALISDKCLTLTDQLLTFLETDDRNLCASKRWLDNPIQLDPIAPFLLFQSIGWQLTLTRNYNNLL
jgi:hypothetical protein